MKQYIIDAPDNLAAQLEAYARQHQQSPEDTLMALAEEALAAAQHTVAPDVSPASKEDDYPDPWAGFHGAFQTPYPDLTLRHDYYIGAAALDPHDTEDTTDAEVDADERQ